MPTAVERRIRKNQGIVGMFNSMRSVSLGNVNSPTADLQQAINHGKFGLPAGASPADIGEARRHLESALSRYRATAGANPSRALLDAADRILSSLPAAPALVDAVVTTVEKQSGGVLSLAPTAQPFRTIYSAIFGAAVGGVVGAITGNLQKSVAYSALFTGVMGTFSDSAFRLYMSPLNWVHRQMSNTATATSSK